MIPQIRPTLGTLVLAASAALVATTATPTAAQNTHVSPVPKEPCCFNNFRFAGTCRVTPRQGQYCENILSYLNSLNSSGETYCSSTYIRGGWTSVDCASGAAAGAVGEMKPQYIGTDQSPEEIKVVTPSDADALTPTGRAPGSVEPRELRARDASVIEVRLERPLEGNRLDAGQELSGRLERDLVDADGEVLAPAGSTISATVGNQPTWDSTAAPGIQLQLVGTTTSAADLFGTVEGEAPAGADDEPSVHLTGGLVELSPDSVLTFRVRELSDQPADMRVLTAATAVWMEAFNSGDAITIAGLWSEDGAMLPPNGRAIIGRDAVYAYWKNLLSASTTRLELVNVETVIEGDLGYKAGRFELVDPISGATVDQGKYMQIWRRSPTGYWELHRDMWNSNAPSARDTSGS